MTTQPITILPTSKWPGHPNWATVTLDYPASAPGVLEIDHIHATLQGQELPVTRQPSNVFPGGWSITYPCQDALLAHVAAMRVYQAKLAAFNQGDDTVDDVNTPTVERPVFARMSRRDGKRLAQPTGQGELW